MKFRLVWMGPEEEPNEPRAALPDVASQCGALWYEATGTRLLRWERSENGRLKGTPVANFTARIVSDIVVDDGSGEQRREFGVEAEVGGRRVSFTLPAAEFGRMAWVLDQLGPEAIVYPGQQQHARAAIQWLSGSISQQRLFAHLGWRKQDSQWVYLHAGGALGSEGPRSGFEVLLAALQSYQLRWPPEAARRRQAVRASLRFLSVAPDRISLPLLAAVYRAALGGVSCSLFLTGPSGVFKSALAAVCQQHFGAGLDASHLPASFSSTSAALEGLAFAAKDALLVVDDFAPSGGQGDGALEGVAERLFRAVGNHQGRSRMRGVAQLRIPQPPRALVLATGEEVPQGPSIRARMLIVEVEAGEVDPARLSECQRAGEQGALAEAMGAFVGWIAARYEQIQRRLETRVLEIRSQSQQSAAHARLPTAVAELQTGWEIFLEFALDIGALGGAEKQEWEQRMGRVLVELAARQAPYQQASDPALRFLALLRAALAGGRAHVADRRGAVPAEAALWGWQRALRGRGWLPRGARIGWVVGSELYLEPATSYQVAQQVAGAARLPVGEQTLRHRMHQRGLLASIDAGRQMLPVRRTLEGGLRQVLHLNSSALVGPAAGASASRSRTKARGTTAGRRS
jgi:hypothetical protein